MSWSGADTWAKYAGCIKHTTLRMFYVLSVVESMQIFGADVMNAFGDAPLPAQGMQC